MFVDRGLTVIRMGSVVKDVMQTDNPGIIEYACRGFRTELLDIYLSAKCLFFINGASGIQSLPMVFRRPIIHSEHVPLEYVMSWSSKSITIFKKYWLKNEHRLMTFREIIESGAGRYVYGQNYEEYGIQLIDNTAEEIADGIKAICAKMREKMPKTKILILAIFPRGDREQRQNKKEDAVFNSQWAKNNQASDLASKIADDKMIYYLDINQAFLTEDGVLPRGIMGDLLHPNTKGYRIWAEAIEPTVKKLMGENDTDNN